MTSLVPNLTRLNMPFKAKRFGDNCRQTATTATAHEKIKENEWGVTNLFVKTAIDTPRTPKARSR